MLSTYEPLFISMLSLIRPKLTSTLSRTFHILFLLSYVFFVLGFNSQKGCAGADYGYLLWAHLKPSFGYITLLSCVSRGLIFNNSPGCYYIEIDPLQRRSLYILD